MDEHGSSTGWRYRTFVIAAVAAAGLLLGFLVFKLLSRLGY